MLPRFQILPTSASLLWLLVGVAGLIATSEPTVAQLESVNTQQADDTRAAATRRFPTIAVTFTDTPPIIDGHLDEEVWQAAPSFDSFTQVNPNEGAAPSVRTVVRLLHDHNNLYVAIRCYQDPATIIATTMLRDDNQSTDDRVAIVIDTFHDRRNGFLFQLNPLGARFDSAIEDNTRTRDDWDGIWHGRSAVDEHGWTCEFAIPFHTFSFDPNSDTWGFNVERTIRRNDETIRWSSPARNTPIRSMATAGTITNLREMEQGFGLDVKPFGIARYRRRDGEDKFELDAGVDFFYNITPSLTASLSFNTDFAETEVDARQVNLTRFPLFFPEKRDFFLRDAGIFNFGGINRNPLPFFSRRIGIGPDGRPRDILVGAKLTGRIENLNLGLMHVLMRDDDVLGQKNLTVGRVSLNVLEESSVGAIFTAGNPGSGEENFVGGVDFLYRNSQFDGDKVVEGSAFFLRSHTSGEDGRQSSFGGKLGYPNDRVNWQIGFTQIDDDFNAALGFVPRGGIREYFANWRYRWRPEEHLRSIDSGLRWFLVTDLDDQVESHTITLEAISIELDSNDELSYSVTYERQQLFDPFNISDSVIIPPGDYDFIFHRFGFESSRGRPVSVQAGVRVGEFFSGDRWDITGGVEWRVSPHLFLSGEYEQNNVDLAEGSFITRVVRARVNVFFTPDIAWTNLIQYDNVSELAGINSRLRWIVEPGSELFVVLNQGFNLTSDTFAPTSTELTTKVGWTFRF